MSFVLGLVLILPLGLGYLVYIMAGKESGQMKMIGQVIAWAMIILVLVVAVQVVFSAGKFQRAYRMGAIGMGPMKMGAMRMGPGMAGCMQMCADKPCCPECQKMCGGMMKGADMKGAMKPGKMMGKMAPTGKMCAPGKTGK